MLIARLAPGVVLVCSAISRAELSGFRWIRRRFFWVFFGFREIRMILEKRGLCRGIRNAVLGVMD